MEVLGTCSQITENLIIKKLSTLILIYAFSKPHLKQDLKEGCTGDCFADGQSE